MINLSQLRRDLKARRRQLSFQQRAKTSSEIVSKILSHTWFQTSQSIAFYLAANGEVDIKALIERAWQMNKTCYLPVLHPLKHNSLWFVAYQPEQSLIKNRYDILEPKIDANSRIIPPWAIDLVFLPLVAFDSQCHRLGTGGGYYDRTFAFINQSPKPRPRMVGVAYEFQKVSQLPSEPWDVQVDHVVTEIDMYLSHMPC
jgi:5-formyltetrahydrofolate cyclo-ligase